MPETWKMVDASMAVSNHAPSLDWEQASGCRREKELEGLAVGSAYSRVQARVWTLFHLTRVAGGLDSVTAQGMQYRPSFVAVE